MSSLKSTLRHNLTIWGTQLRPLQLRSTLCPYSTPMQNSSRKTGYTQCRSVTRYLKTVAKATTQNIKAHHFQRLSVNIQATNC